MSALQEYQARTTKAQEHYFRLWSFVFYFCAITGVLGAIVLIAAFFHSLWKMI